MVKNLPATWETRVQSLGWEDALERREWQPTPVFLPGEFHGQRSLVGYSPWSHKQSDTSEQLILSLFIRKPMSAWAWHWHSSIFERINEWILLYPFANSPNIIWTMQPPDKISIVQKHPSFCGFLLVDSILSWALRPKPSSLFDVGPKALILLTCTFLSAVTVLVVISEFIPVKTLHFIQMIQFVSGSLQWSHCLGSSIQIKSVYKWVPRKGNGKLNSVLLTSAVSLAPNLTFQILSLFN